MRLATSIVQTAVTAGEVAVFSLAQAGFVIKFDTGMTVALDPYLTDCVERLAGFKRLIPMPIMPAELDVDIIAITHNHPDHLDLDALPAWAGMRMHFMVAPDCLAALRKAGIADERITVLHRGESAMFRDVKFTAIDADHGDLAPEAIGIVIENMRLTFYFVGDSGFAPERIMPQLPNAIDVMIAPINGAYGNLNEDDACRFADLVQPRWLIGCHTGMFTEHGGDPARFLARADTLDGITALVMAPGERRIFSRVEVYP